MKIGVGRHVGALLVTGSAVGWSLGGVFTRVIQLDSWTIAAWRGLFGALGLLIVMPMLHEGRLWKSLREIDWSGWFFVLQGSIGMVCYLTALKHTSVANVAVIYATAPFFAAGLGWLLMREKPSTSSVFASLVALVGVVLMVGFGGSGGLVGDLLALAMTAIMASAAVVARNFPRIPILLTACISSLLSGIASWPLGAPLTVTSHEIMWLALFGIVNFAVALPLYSIGARHLPAVETSLIGALDAPLAPLWVWLAFGEIPGASTLVGGAIVFAAVAIHFLIADPQTIKTPIPPEK